MSDAAEDVPTHACHHSWQAPSSFVLTISRERVSFSDDRCQDIVLNAGLGEGPLALSLLVHATTAGVEWLEYHYLRVRTATAAEAAALEGGSAAVASGGAVQGRQSPVGSPHHLGQEPPSSHSKAATARESYVLAGFDVILRQLTNSNKRYIYFQ